MDSVKTTAQKSNLGANLGATTPKKKSTVLYWILGCCGGCLGLMIVVLVIGAIFFRGTIEETLQNLDQSLQNVNTEKVTNQTGQTGDNSSSVNAPAQNSNAGGNNANSARGIGNMNIDLGLTNGGSLETYDFFIEPPSLDPSIFWYKTYFIEPQEAYMKHVTADVDGDGYAEGCVLTLLADESYRVFVLDWNPVAQDYDLVYEGFFPAPVESLMATDYNGDGYDDFVVEGIGIIYDPLTGSYHEMYPFN